MYACVAHIVDCVCTAFNIGLYLNKHIEHVFKFIHIHVFLVYACGCVCMYEYIYISTHVNV